MLFAPYAFRDDATAGRVHPQPPHPYRSPFQRDRDRIIHCAAWRRLSEKTQVFMSDLGDYHRTRLTHTLEVTNLARTLGRALRLNEDLIEALALLHDVGHPPFGHSGEDALDGLLRRYGKDGDYSGDYSGEDAGDGTGSDTGNDTDGGTASHAGFDHNIQALRIVEKLERRYPDFPGLNLSLEILEGQRYKFEKKRDKKRDPSCGSPLLEVQITDVADSVSYDSHDADDAIELGFLRPEELQELALWRRAVAIVHRRWSDLDEQQFRQAVIHALIDIQVGNILEATRRRLEETAVDSIESVRRSPSLAGPDAELAEQKKELESFLFENVYRHPKVVHSRRQAAALIRELFRFHLTHLDMLPTRYAGILRDEGEARAVVDYLADLTDRGVRIEHHRLLQSGDLRPRSPIQNR